MDDARLDLSSLDPTLDEERWSALQQRLRAAATPELTRRASSISGVALLTQWARPILMAAAVLAALSIGTFRIMTPAAGGGSGGTLADELGFPAPVADWLAEERAPDEDDLLLALERRAR